MLSKLFNRARKKEIFTPAELVENYSPTLIDDLESEHRQLLEIFGQIIKSGEANDVRAVHRLLAQFRSVLFDHVMRENGVVYSHIRLAYADEEELLKSINNFKSEMTNIQRNLNEFLRNWTPEKLMEDMEAFLTEIIEVGKKLGIRIQREEKILYPYYREISNLKKNKAIFS